MKPVRVGQLLATVLLAVVTLALPVSSAAQEARGTITGTILDASKGVIPGATVTVTNIAMGTDVSVVTNEHGFFQATYLIPGAYRITVELSGFKKLVREGIEVRVGDRLALESRWKSAEPSRKSRSVAATPLLETDHRVDWASRRRAPRGGAADSAWRSVRAHRSGAPAPRSLRSSRLDRPFEPTHIVGYAMNGTRANRSDVTIDGIPSTATANAGEITASFVPPQGLVQEFNVQTATFDAVASATPKGA